MKSEYDRDFSNSKIELNKVSSEAYKKIVNAETYIKKSNLEKDVLLNMIKQHYLKINRIMNVKAGEEIDYYKFLKIQIELKNKTKEIFILATLLLMVYDHNPEETLKLINVKS